MKIIPLLLFFLCLPAYGSCVFPATTQPHATAVIYNPHYPHSLSTSHGHAGRIYLDNKFVCRLHPGRYIIVPLQPGVHTLRGDNKNSGIMLDFKAGSVHYYKTSYDDHGWTVSTSLAPAPQETVNYELSRMKPENGETKPLPLNRTETSTQAIQRAQNN